MRKIIFLLIFLFPTLTFGQTFTGNYRAMFFNLFSEPKTIVADFEVKTDNSIVGKAKIGDEIKEFSGAVEKNGKFEWVIEQIGNFTYKLKGKFDKNNKIYLIQRKQVGGGLNKSVSESSLERNFAKVEKTSQIAEIQPRSNLVDTGKSLIKVQLSEPFFGNDWQDFNAKIVSKLDGNIESWEILATTNSGDGEQKLTILFPKFFANN